MRWATATCDVRRLRIGVVLDLERMPPSVFLRRMT